MIDACVVVLLSGLLEGLCDTINIRIGIGPLIGCALLLYHFGFTAYRDGRTLGRELLYICVVSATGRSPSPIQGLLRSVARAVPFFFYSHDGPHVAAVMIVIIGAFVIDYILMTASASRQTIGDLLARTLVVRTAPLQPHRAPASPMFSATDREFGLPPKWHDERPKGGTPRILVLAEAVRFELTEGLHPRRFSRPVP